MTPQQEAFAVALAQGQNQADAYRTAYPKSKKWAETSLWPEASRLAADPKVRARVDELKRQAAKANELTVTEHLRTLTELREEARSGGQMSAAIKAEELRGKCSGFYSERIVHDLGTIGPDWKALIRHPEA